MELLGTSRQRSTSRAFLIAALYSGLAVLGVAIAGFRGDWDIYRGPGSTTWKLILSPVVGVAFGVGVVLLSRFAVHRFTWARRLHRDFRGLLGVLPPRDVLILAVASSIGEELLFRGALQPWLGIVPTAAIFALLHVGPGLRFLPWTLSALVVGSGFGLLAMEMGDLGAPIAAHFVVNYLNLGYIVRTELPADDC
jgi:membrane protease YdiL (CAAX protease family)